MAKPLALWELIDAWHKETADIETGKAFSVTFFGTRPEIHCYCTDGLDATLADVYDDHVLINCARPPIKIMACNPNFFEELHKSLIMIHAYASHSIVWHG